nr:TPA_asm: NADH dehydrogenase subunit 5 [Pseudomyrmex dendroicus]
MYNMMVYSFFMFIISFFMFLMSFVMKLSDYMLVFEWMLYNHKSMNMMFYLLLDWMSVQFLGVVMLISSMVMFYSTVYMSDDLNICRFYLLVFMFIVSMILMIVSPNLISILLGWDGLGLVSYCLVIYYNNYNSFNSGMITVLSNRMGDVGLLMSIGLMSMYGSWSKYMLGEDYLIMLFIFLASMTKSAQIPFSYWLPQAMAAPTPVSSLVHSSTLVTAGVYLLIRFNESLMIMKMNTYLFSISLLTMFLAGLMANFEFDLKKIIALSTLSQLGLMLMILSVGAKDLSFFHLETHAIFKSLLFLCAGSLIHLMSNNQDIRYYGKMNELTPFIMMSFYISSLSLCGLPFMSGFYSKDLIMEVFYSHSINMFMMVLSLISLCLTVSYTIRLMYYMYFGSISFYFSWHCFSVSWIMNFSMFVLLFFSIVSGSLISWMLFFDVYDIFLDVSIKMITITACMLGVIVGIFFYFINMIKFYFFSYFMSTMCMMSFFYSFIYKPLMNYWYLFNDVDKVWIEFSSKLFMVNIFENFKIMKGWYNIAGFMFCYLFMLFLILMIVI